MNPYENENVADVLDRSLTMSLDERKLRMNQLKKRERKMDVDAWVRGFLSGMDSMIVSEYRMTIYKPGAQVGSEPKKFSK